LQILTDAINEFVSEIDQTSDEKIEIIIQALITLTKIINTIPNIPELDNARFEFITMSNFVRMTIANYSADSGKANVISSASLLSQLLIGDIPHIEKLNKLPTLDVYPLFKEKYFSIFNTLQSTQAFYSSLISSLNLKRRDSAYSWFNEVLWHGKLLIEHYKRYPLWEILNRRIVRNWEIFFNNLFTMSVPLIETLFTTHEIFVKFGGEWPNGIDDHDLLRVRNLEGLVELATEIQKHIQNTVEVLERAVENRLINPNDDPKRNERYSILEDSIEEVESLLIEIKLHENGQESINQDSLVSFLNSIEATLESQIEFGGGIEAIKENYMIDQIISLLSYLIPYHGLLSSLRNSVRDFEDYLYRHSAIINFINYEEGSTFHFTRILTKIYVYSTCDQKLDLDETLDELLILKDHLSLKPRELLMTLVLIILLNKSQSRKINISQLTNEILNHVFFDESHCHMEEEYRTYINWIQNSIEEPDTNIEKMKYRLEYKMFDVFTLLIPNIGNLLGDEYKNLLYIPFNREVDEIY